jgi:hypothetical protein
MDMLIRLYALDAPPFVRSVTEGVVIRKPIGPEHATVSTWVGAQFTAGWASEAQVALANRPVSLWIAAREGSLLGFACYDATARGLVGPIGVAGDARRKGLGAALLLACLHDMRSTGYAYAVVGDAGEPDFFSRVAGAVAIADSVPGLYGGQLRR